MSNIVAWIVHATPGRTRLRIPSKRGDRAFFQHAGQRLQGCPGVSWLKANPLTGSLLFSHSASLAEIAAFAEAQGMFAIREGKRRGEPPATRATRSLVRIEDFLFRASKGKIDLPSLVFTILLMMSLVQIARGQVLAPASTLLWYALELLGIGKIGFYPREASHGDARRSQSDQDLS